MEEVPKRSHEVTGHGNDLACVVEPADEFFEVLSFDSFVTDELLYVGGPGCAFVRGEADGEGPEVERPTEDEFHFGWLSFGQVFVHGDKLFSGDGFIRGGWSGDCGSCCGDGFWGSCAVGWCVEEKGNCVIDIDVGASLGARRG